MSPESPVESAAAGTPPAPAEPAAQTVQPPREALPPWLALLRRPAVIFALVALALLGWQWIETRARLAEVREELAKRLADSDAVAKESRALARQNQELLLALQGKAGALESRLTETQGQQQALEAMYQELSKSRDERLLSEIEQSVSIAAQQLQLAGNVQAALIALQGADARLARAPNARFLALRAQIARDIERLKALPTADVPGIALKLETVVVAIDTLPLAYEQRPKSEPAAREAKPAQSPTQLTFWQALALDVWKETKQLVRIERIDRPEPGLLSPSQNFFLRENLKLRLANARLALLARDGKTFRADLRQAQDWLEHYFDANAKPVQAAQATLRNLAAIDVAMEPHSLNETLNLLRNFKLAPERK
jgi:uroporphyrin-3 C-methyltransferase